jgi:glycosyltransferase involved in cell wall biosynthesis
MDKNLAKIPLGVKISVVIPTYNRRESLITAIQSVLNQTYQVSTIYICDDGSTDDSFLEIQKINDSRIKWLDCGRNYMPSVPRNYGIQECLDADYVAFLDSDDIWLPEKIEIQLSCIFKWGIKSICSNAIMTSSGNNSEGIYFNSLSNELITYKKLLKNNKIICSSVMIEKTILLKSGEFNESKILRGIEDYELWLRIASFSDWYYLNLPLLKYSSNSHDSIRIESLNPVIQKIIILKYHLKWLIKKRLIYKILYSFNIYFNIYLNKFFKK